MIFSRFGGRTRCQRVISIDVSSFEWCSEDAATTIITATTLVDGVKNLDVWREEVTCVDVLAFVANLCDICRKPL